ncbi:hypothetical protein T440DRAFT_71036 [Plenodomus tracheiphilus IPT5]|uniref:Uncharacterized protein n=1 Tax=Plenodomus tracheiphilus IPT5 TaxID=1408161 RepID=A0A6A7B6L6_9PLEO|nr:hypothetical protein T440DRAFT_71036 [Plenodomus tracheiphilus IPT5]
MLGVSFVIPKGKAYVRIALRRSRRAFVPNCSCSTTSVFAVHGDAPPRGIGCRRRPAHCFGYWSRGMARQSLTPRAVTKGVLQDVTRIREPLRRHCGPGAYEDIPKWQLYLICLCRYSFQKVTVDQEGRRSYLLIASRTRRIHLLSTKTATSSQPVAHDGRQLIASFKED